MRLLTVLLLLLSTVIHAEPIPSSGPGWTTIYNQAQGTGSEADPYIPVVVDYYFAIAEREVADKSIVTKFGRNPDVDAPTGTWEAVWNQGGAYTGFNATAAEIIEVSSSSIADAGALVSSGTATGGTATTLVDAGATFITDTVAVGDIILNDSDLSHGVVTVVTSETVLTVRHFDKPSEGSHSNAVPVVGDAYRVATASSTGAAVVELVYLLDGDLTNETSEFIILNGTTGVDTTGSYRRNSRITVLTAGSGGENAGTITSRQKTTTANIFAVMPIGYNETMIAAYTVPKDREGHILAVGAAPSGKVTAIINIRLQIRHPGEVFTVKEEWSVAGGGFNREFKVPKNSLTPGSDMFIEADSDTNNTGVAAWFDMVTSVH